LEEHGKDPPAECLDFLLEKAEEKHREMGIVH